MNREQKRNETKRLKVLRRKAKADKRIDKVIEKANRKGGL